jgi:hypothetical protein
MKRTCNNCLASDWEKGCYICNLDYDVDIKRGVPKEECPKPLTNSQLINAKHKYMRRL